MHSLIVGVGHISLLFRHCRTLKDKRQILRGIIQKLRNQGFSVTECGFSDQPKQGSVGFAYAGHTVSHVDKLLDEGLRLFVGEIEVVQLDRDVFDYSHEGRKDEFDRDDPKYDP